MRTFIAVCRSHRAILLLCVALGLACGAAYSLLAEDRYVSTATLLIDGGLGDGSRFDLLASEKVAQRVAENEHLVREAAFRGELLRDSSDARSVVEAIGARLASMVRIERTGEGQLALVRVATGDPALSARIANAWARAFGEVSLSIRAEAIRAGVERARKDLSELQQSVDIERRLRGQDGAVLARYASAEEQFAKISRMATESGSTPASLALAPTNPPVDAIAVPPDASSERPSVPSTAVATDRAPSDPVAGQGDELILAQASLRQTWERLARISNDGIGLPFPAHTLVPAHPDTSSIKPGWGACLLAGLLGGVALGLVLLAILERVDRRVRIAADVARVTGLVVLGDLPAASRPMRAGLRGRRMLDWSAPLERQS